MITSNIRELMEKQRITIRAMVEKTGLADMTILRARREEIIHCRLSTLEIIAKFLGCSVKELFKEN